MQTQTGTKTKPNALGRERLDAAAVEDQALGVARDLAGPAAVHAVVLEHVGLLVVYCFVGGGGGVDLGVCWSVLRQAKQSKSFRFLLLPPLSIPPPHTHQSLHHNDHCTTPTTPLNRHICAAPCTRPR